jgi:hypothetical protein
MAMAKTKKTAARKQAPVRLYTLDVAVSKGEQRTASRTIQVRGDQTLEVLHQAIAAAFERAGEFSYEFQLGESADDPVGARYVLPGAFDIAAETGVPASGRVTDTSLDSIGLRVGQTFECWSDTGDDWWHPIMVARIQEGTPKGKYPRVTRRVGDSPFRRKVESAVTIGKEEGADAACLVGEMHLQRREYHKAVEAFSRAIENRPSVDAYEGRAKAYRGLASEDIRNAEQLRSK